MGFSTKYLALARMAISKIRKELLKAPRGFGDDRPVHCLMGNLVKGRYWQRVADELKKKPYSIMLADKNAPNEEVWRQIVKKFHRTGASAVPVDPESEGTDSNPFSLASLAIFTYRVLQCANHPGNLDGNSPNAGYVLPRFYHIYEGKSCCEFDGELVECFGSLVKIPLLKSDRNPLPDTVKSTLEEGMKLYKLHTMRHGRLESTKGTHAKEWAQWEKQWRDIFFGNAEYLNSVQVQEVSEEPSKITKGEYKTPEYRTPDSGKRKIGAIVFATISLPIIEIKGLLDNNTRETAYAIRKLVCNQAIPFRQNLFSHGCLLLLNPALRRDYMRTQRRQYSSFKMFTPMEMEIKMSMISHLVDNLDNSIDPTNLCSRWLLASYMSKGKSFRWWFSFNYICSRHYHGQVVVWDVETLILTKVDNEAVKWALLRIFYFNYHALKGNFPSSILRMIRISIVHSNQSFVYPNANEGFQMKAYHLKLGLCFSCDHDCHAERDIRVLGARMLRLGSITVMDLIYPTPRVEHPELCEMMTKEFAPRRLELDEIVFGLHSAFGFINGPVSDFLKRFEGVQGIDSILLMREGVQRFFQTDFIDMSEELHEKLKTRFPSFPNTRKGVLVRVVTSELTAPRSRFLNLDLITKIDGNLVNTIAEILEIVDEKLRPYTVTVRREHNARAVLTVYILKDP